MAKLSFGSIIERKRKLKNDKLTPEKREFEGEFGVFIKFANWAVGNCEPQICCNDDSNEVDRASYLNFYRRIEVNGKTQWELIPLSLARA